MLTWTLIFLVVAIVAGIFGFTGIASGATTMAKALFFIFVAIFIVTLFMGLLRT